MSPGEIAGMVLAGGQATRLGGGDKPFRSIDGRPMLARVLERLSRQVGPMAISANGDPARFARYGLPVLPDQGRSAGPLSGILSGLAWAKSIRCSSLLAVAGDTPFFPDDLAARLKAAGDGHDGASVAASGGRRHPVFALWPVALEAELRRFLAEASTSSVAAFLDSRETVTVDFPMTDVAGRTIDPFFNVNTPEELAEAEAIARGHRTMTQRVFGITGWKNSGKTTLTERLVGELSGRGWRVSTVKHAHHEFDIDKEGTDSFRHRKAGAGEVAIVSDRRWALMHELRGENEPTLEDVLKRLGPCDLVLVEGYKRENHKKIETRRTGAKDTTPLSAGDPTILAIAADAPIPGEKLPVFSLDDVVEIADFIESSVGLSRN